MVYHKNYSIDFPNNSPWLYQYSHGAIERSQMFLDTDSSKNAIALTFRNGETYTWNSKYFDAYIDQFGIAVSFDGTKVFAQTWENGLLCFDSKTGKLIWRTKSRKGITSIYVSDDTITVQLHNYAMQLLDINSGEVIKEKRPSTAWGFTTLDHQHIICQTTARKWELIEASTLNVKEIFTRKEFTGDNMDFCVEHIRLLDGGTICVKGFRNAWDNSTSPPTRLPNIEFENHLRSNTLSDH